MAVCAKCGEKLEAKAKFCTKCGTPVAGKKQNTKTTTTVSSSDTKVYKILSYVGILWLIGLFVKEKDDSKLKFHVGQGIILTIYNVAINIVVNIINSLIILKIFRVEETFFGYGTGVYTTSAVGLAISGILSLAAGLSILAFMIIGIINAVKDEEKELPIIGKYAFYK